MKDYLKHVKASNCNYTKGNKWSCSLFALFLKIMFFRWHRNFKEILKKFSKKFSKKFQRKNCKEWCAKIRMKEYKYVIAFKYLSRPKDCLYFDLYQTYGKLNFHEGWYRKQLKASKCNYAKCNKSSCSLIKLFCKIIFFRRHRNLRFTWLIRNINF